MGMPMLWRGGLDTSLRGGDERLKNMDQEVLKPHNLAEQLCILGNCLSRQEYPSILALFDLPYQDDLLRYKILKAISEGDSLRESTVVKCTEHNWYVQYRKKRYVPKSNQICLRLIQEHHDTVLAGHPRRAKLFDLLDRQYYWKDMGRKVDQYVRNCHCCQQSRTSRYATFGVLRHLPVPEIPLEDISLDIVVGLPECERFDAVWVLVDRHLKMWHLFPSHTTIDAVGLLKLFLRDIVWLHGLPKNIFQIEDMRLCQPLGDRYVVGWGLMNECLQHFTHTRMVTPKE
jgi:hypothetical protein